MSCSHVICDSGVNANTIVGIAYGAISITIASANLFLEYRKFRDTNRRGMFTTSMVTATADATWTNNLTSMRGQRRGTAWPGGAK